MQVKVRWRNNFFFYSLTLPL